MTGITEDEFRSARLFPYLNVFPEYFEQEYTKFISKEPEFNAMERHQEYQDNNERLRAIDWDFDTQGPLKIYADYEVVIKALTDKRFQFVDHPKDANVLWLAEDYNQKRFLEWGIDFNKVYVSYFKMEAALVIKNAIANMINSTLKDKSCIQQTFDLESALPAFVGCFLDRQKKGLDNTWIIKPTAMARSMDTWVTRNVDQIVRLVDTGPKVAQKYITNPITFNKRKIDLRYVVVLKSLMPLELFVH